MPDVIETVCETQAKSILTSKTFWANVVMTPAALWLGRHNIVFDPATQASMVLVFIGLANLVLRKLTTGPVVLTLPKGAATLPATPGAVKTLQMLFFAFLLTGLWACAPTTSALQSTLTTAQQNALQTVYAARSAYMVALGLADVYVELPACGTPGATKICKQPTIVTGLQNASTVISTDLNSADAAIAAGTSTTASLTQLSADLQALQTIVSALPQASTPSGL